MQFYRELGSKIVLVLWGVCRKMSIARGGIYYTIKHCAIVVPLLRHMAIAAHFDLEIKQFDVINAFANAKRLVGSLLVACQLLDSFKIPGMCAKIDRALAYI
jgi:hypothetical protein